MIGTGREGKEQDAIEQVEADEEQESVAAVAVVKGAACLFFVASEVRGRAPTLRMYPHRGPAPLPAFSFVASEVRPALFSLSQGGCRAQWRPMGLLDGIRPRCQAIVYSTVLDHFYGPLDWCFKKAVGPVSHGRAMG